MRSFVILIFLVCLSFAAYLESPLPVEIPFALGLGALCIAPKNRAYPLICAVALCADLFSPYRFISLFASATAAVCFIYGSYHFFNVRHLIPFTVLYTISFSILFFVKGIFFIGTQYMTGNGIFMNTFFETGEWMRVIQGGLLFFCFFPLLFFLLKVLSHNGYPQPVCSLR